MRGQGASPAVTRFRTACVLSFEGKLIHLFADGRSNVFDVEAAANEEYREIARWAGYGDDYKRYGLEHELTHHWLADRLGWKWSWSLHDNPPQPWPDNVAWEEHLVNRWQRSARAGAIDEFGVLDAVVRRDYAGWVRDWFYRMDAARTDLGW